MLSTSNRLLRLLSLLQSRPFWRGRELAARMQLAAPEALNLKAEPAHVLKLYGLDGGPQTWPKEISADEEAFHFSQKCLAARRLLDLFQADRTRLRTEAASVLRRQRSLLRHSQHKKKNNGKSQKCPRGPMK